MAAKARGQFIDPMLLLRTDSLPNDGDRWEYQLKFDGYRAIAFKSGGKIQLRSRNDNDFSVRYADVMKGLAKLPDETVIDGEVLLRRPPKSAHAASSSVGRPLHVGIGMHSAGGAFAARAALRFASG